MNTLKLIDSVDPFFKLGSDIACIVNLLSRPWEVKVQHVFRETNYANFMAKRGMEDTTPYVMVDRPPLAMIHLLQDDACSLLSIMKSIVLI